MKDNEDIGRTIRELKEMKKNLGIKEEKKRKKKCRKCHTEITFEQWKNNRGLLPDEVARSNGPHGGAMNLIANSGGLCDDCYRQVDED